MAQDSHNSSQETPPGPESKKSFFRDNPGFYLTVSYIVISIVGLALEAIFLAQFDIFILSYAEVNDFLFSFVKLFPAVFISILMFSAYLILLFLGLSYLDTIRHEFEAVRRVAPETAVKRLAARSGQWLQNTAQAIAFFFKTLVGLMPKAVDDIRSMERARFAKYLKPAAIALFAGLIIAPLWSARIIEEEIQSVKDGDADTKWTLTQFPLVSVALRFGSPRYLCNLVQLSSTSSHFVFLDFAGETRHSHLIPIANVADLSHQDKRVVTPDERCPADTTGLPPTGGQEPHMKAIGMRLYEIRRELAALDGPLKSIATESAGWDRPTGSQLVELQDALEQIAGPISDISVQVDLTPLSEKIDRIAMELGGLHKTIRDWDKPTGPQLTALDQNVGAIAAGLDTFMEHGTIEAMLAILTNLENRLGEIKDAVVVCEGERCPERPNLLKAILDIEETLGDLISAATQFPKAVEKNFAEVKEEIRKTLIHHGSLPNGCKLLVDEKTERKLFVHFRRDSSEPFPDPDYGSGEEGSTDIAGQNRAIIDLIVKNLTERLKHTPQSRVLIVGYADSTGSPTHNLGLSEGRATAVYREIGLRVRTPETTDITPLGRGEWYRTDVKGHPTSRLARRVEVFVCPY